MPRYLKGPSLKNIGKYVFPNMTLCWEVNDHFRIKQLAFRVITCCFLYYSLCFIKAAISTVTNWQKVKLSNGATAATIALVTMVP